MRGYVLQNLPSVQLCIRHAQNCRFFSDFDAEIEYMMPKLQLHQKIDSKLHGLVLQPLMPQNEPSTYWQLIWVVHRFTSGQFTQELPT